MMSLDSRLCYFHMMFANRGLSLSRRSRDCINNNNNINNNINNINNNNRLNDAAKKRPSNPLSTPIFTHEP